MENEMKEVSSDDFGKLSKYNSAALVNMTLNNLWVDYFKHLRLYSYFQANDDLDCIWTILGGEKKIETDDKEAYKTIQSRIKKVGITPILTEKDRKNIKILAKFAVLKSIIMEKGLFLRTLQNKQGKGTAYVDEDEGDFD